MKTRVKYLYNRINNKLKPNTFKQYCGKVNNVIINNNGILQVLFNF